MERRNFGPASRQTWLGQRARNPGCERLRPRISADGTRILFLAQAGSSAISQVFLIRSDGSGRQQITQEPEGIESATLSGNGRIAWAVTNRGRLLQLDLTSGGRREFIGAVPAVLDAPFFPGIQPELVNRIAAAGQPITVPASVVADDIVGARVNELEAPVLRVENGLVTLQIPWEAQPGVYGIALYGGVDSGWTGVAGKVAVYEFAPRFFSADATRALAAQEKLTGW